MSEVAPLLATTTPVGSKGGLKSKLRSWYEFLATAPPDYPSDDDDEGEDEEEDDESPAPVSVKALFRYNSTEDHMILACAVIVSVLLGAGTFSWTYLFVHVANIFNNYASSTVTGDEAANNGTLLANEIHSMTTIFFSLAVAFFFLGYARVYLWTQVSERTVRNIRRKYYSSVLNQSVGWHDFHPSGELVTILTNEISTIQDGLSDLCGQMIEGMSSFVVGIIFALVISFRYSIVLFGFLSFIMVSSTVAYNVVAKVLLKLQDSRSKAGNVVNETIAAIRTVKAFGGEADAVEKYDCNLKNVYQLGIRRGFLSGLEIGFSSLYFNLIYSFGLYYGLEKIKEGGMGVDILQSQRGPLILEVNPSPGLEGITKTTNIDVADKIIEFIESSV